MVVPFPEIRENLGEWKKKKKASVKVTGRLKT